MLSVCAKCTVCNISRGVKDCERCVRRVCMECYGYSCKGCEIDQRLESKYDSDENNDLVMWSHPTSKRRGSEHSSSSHCSILSSIPTEPMETVEYMEEEIVSAVESGTSKVLELSQSQWRHGEEMLMGMLSVRKEIPMINAKYLVGRFVYPNSYPVITDYMISCEEISKGVYGWMRYMTTYYDKSPLTHDKNIICRGPQINVRDIMCMRRKCSQLNNDRTT